MGAARRDTGKRPGAGGYGVAVRVVFVTGWMRSGTTLLGELIGACPGSLTVGELTHIWRAFDREDPCSCGAPVAECRIWGVVAGEVLARHGIGTGPNATTSYQEFHQLVFRIMTIWRVPGLRRLRADRPERFPADVARLVEVMRTVFEIVGRASGDARIVETSKSPAALLTFRLLPELQIRPVHIARDPRAVALSESRSRKWDGVSDILVPRGRSVLRSAVYWSVFVPLCHLIGRGQPGYRFLRYEQLAAHPEPTITALAAQLGLTPPTFLEPGVVQLAESHLIAGNPSRFGGKARRISVDERWRTGLSRSERWLVTVVTAPSRLLLRAVGA